MQSRWEEGAYREALERWGAEGPDLAARVYSSRLIGADPALVLHGGGNTSVKGVRRTLLGEDAQCIWVKGSGSSLDAVGPRDFPCLDLAYLRRLAALSSLSDEAMVNELRTHLFDASSPNPSIEALLHAFLPHKFVDHSHADAIVSVTNRPAGAERVRDALGDRVALLPYVMPGYPLAKEVKRVYESNPSVVGVVLEKHGLFTFGESARESYERHIELCDAAERYAARVIGKPIRVEPVADDVAGRAALAGPILRGLLAERTASGAHRLVVLDHHHDAKVADYLSDERAAALSAAGPLTPDHVIRTKAAHVFVGAPSWGDEAALRRELEAAVGSFRAAYDAYFERESASRPGARYVKLDSAPRVILLGGAGIFAFGRTKKDARIARDITEHTLATKLEAARGGGYEALGASDLFEMEYWSLEQAKLGKAAPRPLEGRVAVITGGAGAIGRAIAEACVGAGAHVALLDRDGARAAEAAASLPRDAALALEADVTSEASMRAAFDAVCAHFGGVDVAVPNAGIALVKPIAELGAAEAHAVSDVNYVGVLNTIREAARVFRAQGTGGSVVLNASKNVFAPGKDFAAYSASKAAAHQLAKIAALELAPLGVRVNMINADAVFSHGATPSGLWSEVGPARAASRGLALDALPAFYHARNLLQRPVEARHVADAVVFFAATATATTGATLPVDGGIPEAFPR
ncbi:MAG: bifunctional aldolase/short-chain dehydrogenase [Polyangiaceae bacterium]